jgi:hypothetical protein
MGDFVGAEGVVGVEPLDVLALGLGEAEVAGVGYAGLGAVEDFVGEGGLGEEGLGEGDDLWSVEDHRVVGGVVVDQEDFDLLVGLLEAAFEAVGEGCVGVVAGDDDGNA